MVTSTHFKFPALSVKKASINSNLITLSLKGTLFMHTDLRTFKFKKDFTLDKAWYSNNQLAIRESPFYVAFTFLSTSLRIFPICVMGDDFD
jgi:hypothetical protein